MDQILEKFVQSSTATGVLAAVNRDGEISTYSAGSITSHEHNTPFYIYSISKTYTAIAILKLCEDHGCFLNTSVTSLLPHYDIPQDVTVRMLLNHTSGLSDYFCEKQYQDAVHGEGVKPWTYQKLMKVGLAKTPLFQAGEGWFYSNPGYGMLKEIIELKSSMPFYDFVHQEIFSPLGLSQTRPFVECDYQLQLLESADDSMGGDVRLLYDPAWIATGCFISTVAEVTKVYQALFSGELISKDYLRQMTELVELKFPMPEPIIACYGLGLMSAKNDPTGTNYGHGGGGPGYTTYVRHYPDHQGQQISIAFVVNNSMPQTPFHLADQIFESLT